jgi:hypothetical protein
MLVQPVMSAMTVTHIQVCNGKCLSPKCDLPEMDICVASPGVLNQYLKVNSWVGGESSTSRGKHEMGRILVRGLCQRDACHLQDLKVSISMVKSKIWRCHWLTSALSNPNFFQVISYYGSV